MRFLKSSFILSSVSCLTLIGCSSGSGSTTPTSSSQFVGDRGSSASISTSSYQFVVDAGSSGSRIYVYSTLQTESGPIINSLYESKINIPLASFANNIENAGSYGIQPLLTNAISFMKNTEPNVILSEVPTSVLGTAGMRLISESQQRAIYQNVATSIVQNGLQLQETRTITGQDEGIYSWADANYLQNNFDQSTITTSGIFEVGGASAQIVFATTQAVSESVIPVIINNNRYTVYSVSFLGLGQDVARNDMNSLSNRNACYPMGYMSTLPFDITGNFNYNNCTTNYISTIALYPEINQVKNVLGFSTESFIGISSVYYTLHFWNIESQPALLDENIKKTCSENINEIITQHPGAYKPENQCANSVFINRLLFDNLAMKSNQLTAVDTINDTALSWTLGYVLIQK